MYDKVKICARWAAARGTPCCLSLWERQRALDAGEGGHVHEGACMQRGFGAGAVPGLLPGTAGRRAESIWTIPASSLPRGFRLLSSRMERLPASMMSLEICFPAIQMSAIVPYMEAGIISPGRHTHPALPSPWRAEPSVISWAAVLMEL